MGVVENDGLRRTRLDTGDESALKISPVEVPNRTAEQMARLLGKPLPLAPWTLPCGTRLTTVWTRDAFHGYAAGMDGHLIAGYHRRAQRCSWTVENRRLAGILSPRTMTLIPATYDGQWTLAGPLEVSHVYLSTKRFESSVEQLGGGRNAELVGRVGHDDPALVRVLDLLSHEASTQSAPTLFVDEMLDLLCLQLIRRHCVFSQAPVSPLKRGLTPKQLRLVTGYMREHLERDITLAELANLLQLSRFYFCTAFRSATGKRPHEWLTLQRIARARTLLKDGGLRIVDVGLAVGYQTPSAFAAAFRKVMGQPPSEYRRQLRH
jgi:AraC family transcriptional regulator